MKGQAVRAQAGGVPHAAAAVLESPAGGQALAQAQGSRRPSSPNSVVPYIQYSDLSVY